MSLFATSFPPRRKVVPVPERLDELEGHEERCLAGRDEGTVAPVDPDVALHRSPALGHPVGLGGLHLPALDEAGLADDIRGEDDALPADAGDEEVEGGHAFPSFLSFSLGPMAPEGQTWAQTPHPEQSSLMDARSSTISMAGHPNRMQVPQTVQASLSTA
jgi:hypothetical protein